MVRIKTSAMGLMVTAGMAVLSMLPASVSGQALNTLTAEEAAAGWQLLFNGASNAGWIRPNGSPGQFLIEENALRNSGGDICTQADYEHFEFSFDYKYGPQSNSGVFLRTQRGIDPPYKSGIEIGIQDNGKAGYLFKTGDASVYAVKEPSVDKWTGPEIWNSMLVRVVGTKLENHHNGMKVIDMDMASQEWKDSVAKSKFGDGTWPIWGKASKGQLCLQDHGSSYKILFRNIKVRTLTPGASLPSKAPGAGFQWEILGSGSGRSLAVDLPGSRETELYLLDMHGKEIGSIKSRSPRAVLPLGILPSGIYWLRVLSPANQFERRIAIL